MCSFDYSKKCIFSIPTTVPNLVFVDLGTTSLRLWSDGFLRIFTVAFDRFFKFSLG